LHPQANLNGQQGFSWLLQAKRKVKKKSSQDEQLRLLKQILVELQKLNANLSNTTRQPTTEQGVQSAEADDEELEDYE